MQVLTRAGIVVALAATLTEPAQPQALDLNPCTVSGVEGRAACGTLEVFEDRVRATGRRIPINVVVLRATTDTVLPDPVVYFAGGPGQAATEEAAAVAARLAAVRRRRDIILVDQRGTGRSNPLDCPIVEPGPALEAWFAGSLAPATVTQCRDRLQQGADLRLYGTGPSVDDVDDVRRALRVAQINLVGVSYGTRAALVYLRRHPAAVRTVTLISVSPPGVPVRLTQARYTESALAALAAACTADTLCASAFPAFLADLDTLLARTRREPLRLAVTMREPGGTVELRLTPEILMGAIGRMLYNGGQSRDVPAAVRELLDGRGTNAARVFALLARGMDRALYAGKHLSVNCAEDLAGQTERDADTAAAGTRFGPGLARALLRACAQWPRAALESDFASPVTSPVPALLVSGADDPVTPPANAALVARTLSGAASVVIQGWAHAPAPPCLNAMITRLIESGTSAGLGDACAGLTSRLPFRRSVPEPR